MARPKSPPFTLGKISYRPHPTMPSQRAARGYFNDAEGQRQEITARGKTDAAARRELQAKMNAARETYRGGDDVLRHDTTMSRAAAVWLDWKARERLAASSLDEYRHYVNRCVDGSGLASLTLVQVNDIARIEAWLTRIADDRGETSAKQARKVLGGILALAERRGAISASVMHRVQTPRPKAGSTGDRKCQDPECDYDCGTGKRHLDTKRAFTVDEAVRIQAIADESGADVGDLAAFLFGTGVRISEALHCTAWADLDLEARTVRVRGTKTAQADRVLTISEDLTERLRRRAELYGTQGLVFGVTRYEEKLGAPRNRNNVCKVLRRVLKAAGARWAGTHTWRRSTASWMDAAGASLAEIANQLGHGDINVTAQYLGRRTAPTRAAEIMVLPKP